MIAQVHQKIQPPTRVPIDRLPYSRVLVLLDGSALAEEALPVAVALARQAETNGKVILLPLHLTECIISSRGGPVAVPSVVSQEIDSYLAHLETIIRAQGTEAEIVHIEGDLVTSLAHVVRNHQVNLLIMVTHASEDMNRIIPGSIAGHLLNRVNIPILLLKQGEGAVLRLADVPQVILYP